VLALTLTFQQFSFGQILIDGIEYGYDVVIDRGKVGKRHADWRCCCLLFKKAPSLNGSCAVSPEETIKAETEVANRSWR